LTSWHNDNINYLFVSVDVLSRFLHVEPLVNKEANTAKEGLVKMIQKRGGRFPQKIWVDKGTEFKGAFASFCRKNAITIYATHSETKSAMSERYIRTLKSVLYTYLKHKHSLLENSSSSYNLRGGRKKKKPRQGETKH